MVKKPEYKKKKETQNAQGKPAAVKKSDAKAKPKAKTAVNLTVAQLAKLQAKRLGGQQKKEKKQQAPGAEKKKRRQPEIRRGGVNPAYVEGAEDPDVQRLPKAGLVRLLHLGGMSGQNPGIVRDVQTLMDAFLDTVLYDAALYTEHGRRKTIKQRDAIAALQLRGFYTWDLAAHNTEH